MLAATALLLAPADLAALDWLVGHCWRASLPIAEMKDTHCFKRTPEGVLDRHEVTRGGETLYWGETRYSWDDAAKAIRFRYSNADGPVGEGIVVATANRLDFGTAAYAGRKTNVNWFKIDGGSYETVSAVGETTVPTRQRFVKVN